MYEYGARLAKSAHDPTGVVDGDTMHITVDMGMDIANSVTLRVYGVNAPEMSTPEGKAAKIWAIEWFNVNCPDGKFTLQTVKDKREKYGRYLATILAPTGNTFNTDIVAAGHAVPYFP
jgi:endonuclease YncB( thermonuclease family)